MKGKYLPYGSASDRRDARNRYRYLGVERDEETGLMMTGPRTYDAGTGRFWQGDPLAGEQVDKSPFGYASGNPVGRLDWSGYEENSFAEAERQWAEAKSAGLEAAAHPMPSLTDWKDPGQAASTASESISAKAIYFKETAEAVGASARAWGDTVVRIHDAIERGDYQSVLDEFDDPIEERSSPPDVSEKNEDSTQAGIGVRARNQRDREQTEYTRVRHYTNRTGSKRIEADGVIRAHDNNRIYVEFANKKALSRVEAGCGSGTATSRQPYDS
ncbi:MAG: hypothetical protein JXX28_08370 [Deltaproteobacteria bacterium]|nr:hypothetical protein [Deltaproteobacteria bacterium]